MWLKQGNLQDVLSACGLLAKPQEDGLKSDALRCTHRIRKHVDYSATLSCNSSRGLQLPIVTVAINFDGPNRNLLPSTGIRRDWRKPRHFLFGGSCDVSATLVD